MKSSKLIKYSTKSGEVRVKEKKTKGSKKILTDVTDINTTIPIIILNINFLNTSI